MAFPSTVAALTDPQSTDRLNSPSHSAIEQAQNTNIEEIQTFIGTTNTSTVGTLLYDVRAPGSNGGGHIQSANKGGTGQTSYTKGDILVAQSASMLTKLAVGGVGQVLIANDNSNVGVQWNSVAGLPNSVLSVFPRSPMPVARISTFPLSSPSVAVVWKAEVPFPIRVSTIGVVSASPVSSGSPIDITIYKENGSSSVLTATTTGINSVYTTHRAFLSTPKNLDAGNYYFMANTDGGTGGEFQMLTWREVVDSSENLTSVMARLGNIPGYPVMMGTYAIAGGAPPASILTTAITSVATSQGIPLYLRIDG